MAAHRHNNVLHDNVLHNNVLHQLIDREISISSNNYRKNMRILRQIICQDCTVYRKQWEKRSRAPIAYENGRIYLENYRKCYTRFGKNSKPQLRYQLPDCPNSEKIESPVVCQARLDSLPLDRKGYKECLLALTADNRLVRYDSDSGELLENWFLSSKYKFRNLSWETEQERVVVKSVHIKQSQFARAAQIAQPMLLVLSLFNVFPLEFVAMLEIEKKIFGKNICDASISEGILIIFHQQGVVKLYSLENILQNYKCEQLTLGQRYAGRVVGTVGVQPLGIPCNVKITELPQLLFQVQCHDHNLQIGGFPWHYIITPYRQKREGSFHVYSLETNKLALNGRLSIAGISIEPDRAIFYPDDSGRILHIGPDLIKVYQIKNNEGDHELVECFNLDMVETFSTERQSINVEGGHSNMVLTSSGRLVKKRVVRNSYRPDYDTMQSVDYENDLDMLAVTVAWQPDSEECVKGHMCFLDNQTGAILKEIQMEEEWDEECDHQISVDLDCIVHISKCPSRKFHCVLYQLDRMEEDLFTPNKKKQRVRLRK